MEQVSSRLRDLAFRVSALKGFITPEEINTLTETWWGRGKGNSASTETLNLIREVGARFPTRSVPELYRGLSLPNGTLSDPQDLSHIGRLVGGYRSWSKNKAGARQYATMDLSPTADQVFITWQNPPTSAILMDCSYIEKAAKGVTQGGSPFDTSEFVADASNTKVISVDSVLVGKGGVEVEPGRWKIRPKFMHQIVIG